MKNDLEQSIELLDEIAASLRGGLTANALLDSCYDIKLLTDEEYALIDYRLYDAMARANTLRTDKPAADQDG